MDALHCGDALYVDEAFEEALGFYGAAGESGGAAASAGWLNRAACHLKLGRFAQALQDCNKALAILPEATDDESRRRRDLAYWRKGLACFELDEFETAKESLERGLELRRLRAGGDVLGYERCIRKCNVELEALAKAAAPRATATTAPPPQKPQPQPLQATRYQYYQTEAAVHVSVLAKNMDPGDVTVSITPDHLRVVLADRDEVVIDKQLFATIDAAKSRFEVRKAKIEIVLAKTERYEWHSLENTGKLRDVPSAATAIASDAATAAAAAAPPAAPQRPKAYASAKDWDQVGSAIDKELEEDKPEGEEALQKLFRDIYAKADEDTKRAMNKSFQTSGGTVLSTNWKEVGTKKYEEERQAPKGMEWRNWEGDKLKQVEDDP